MTRSIKTLALVFVLLSFATAAEAQLAPADAGAFMGSWTLNLDSPQGAFEQSLMLKDEGGKVVAEMSNQMQPEVQKVTDVTKNGNDLVLKFAGNFQGNPFDAVVTLVPDGTDKCKVTFDINSGMFTMNGTGTKK
ncbi:MAG TPA: hypothetical protein VNT81_04135 [Vicinamibacterales bacterium]|nr:hypothetical protein [Vicinamibacterales bacterium]